MVSIFWPGRGAGLGPVLLSLVAVLASCKTRDPNQAGLLSAVEPSTDGVAVGGVWVIDCQPIIAEKEPSSTAEFHFFVQGAVAAGNEAQDLLVSLTWKHDGKAESIVEKAAGQGTVANGGDLFLSFGKGVLTGTPLAAGSMNATHAAVLTLSAETGVNGLQVQCKAVKDLPK